MRRFEFSEGTSNKFWQVTQEGTDLHIQWGRIGTAGQAQTKAHGSESAAKAEHDKLVAEKSKKGYAEVKTDEAASPSPAPAATNVAAAASAVAAAAAVTVPAVPLAKAAASKATKEAAPALPRAAVVVAEGDRIAWPAELRTEADEEEKRAFVALPSGARPALVAIIKEKIADEVKNWELGRPKGDSEGTLAMAHLLATYAAGKEPPELDALAEARAATLLYEGEALAALGAYWGARGGLSFAIDATAAMWGYQRSYDYAGWKEARPTWVTKADPLTAWDSSVNGAKITMLGVVASLSAAADTAGRSAARTHAEKVRSESGLPVRVGLALAMRDEVWAHEDARAVLALTGANARDASDLVFLLTDRELLVAFAKQFPTRSPLRMVGRAGFAAAPVVQKMLDDQYGRDDAAKALSVLESAESAKALATVLDKRTTAPIARAFFERRPDLGIAALAAVVAGKGNLATYAEPVLKGILRAHPEIVQKVLPTLDARVRSVVEKELAASAPVADASPEEMPQCLVTPPWTQPRPKSKGPVTIPLDLLPADLVIHWSDAQAKAAVTRGESALQSYQGYDKTPKGLKARTKEADAFAEKMIKEGKTWGVTAVLHLATDACAEKLLAGKENLGDPDLPYLLGRFGAKALPFVSAYLERHDLDPTTALADVEASVLAPAFTAAFAKKKWRRNATQWLVRFPAAAATGIVPMALGATKKEREPARAALRTIAGVHRKEVDAAAARYGKAAADAITALLDAPSDEIPDKISALPAFADPSALPRPRLLGGKKALPASGLRALLTLLQLSTLEEPISMLEGVAAAFEPKSLAELAWELFQAWLTGGAASKENWAFTALGLIGDDECARRITPLIRAWPGESQHARAVTGLDVLASIGTDVALMHLHGIAQKLKFKGLQEKAREKIQVIADSRGLTADELADRLVPDLGLDDSGSLALDFGPRQFTVTFDESLKPMVRDAAGKISPDLPKPGKSDDAEKSTAAVETWKALKKDAKAIAQGQLIRLEMVMCAQRRFPAESFQGFFADHPLMIHLVRRVVWGVYTKDGALASTFRVAEDRSFGDAKDREVSLDDDAIIGLPHRLEMDDALVAAWGQVLTDYEIIQPFDQLARMVFRITPAEAKGNSLDRMKDVEVKTSKIQGLESRGWRKGQPQDAGWVWDVWKPLPGGIVAEMGIQGGICMGYMEGTPTEQKLGSVSLRKKDEWQASKELTLASLSAAVFSELVRDIEGIKE